MAEEVVKRDQFKRKYSDAQKMEALEIMAATGSRKKASELTGVPANTLNDWAYAGKYRHKYKEMRKIAREQLTESELEAFQGALDEALETTELLRKEMVKPENLSEIPARDLPGAYRNAGTVAGITADKIIKLREQLAPTANVNITLDATELIQSFARDGKLTDENNKPLSIEEALAKAAPIEGKAEEISAES